MIIDINQHWLPGNLFTDKALLDSWIRSVPRAYDTYAYLSKIPGTNEPEIIVEQPKGFQSLNFGPNHVGSAQQHLDGMKATGVDKAILRVPCWAEWLTLEQCRYVNDELAKLIKQYPDKFMSLAVVPPWGDDECLYEADRCIKELGCIGVQLQAHYGTLYLDTPEFKPYMKKINDLNVPCCVHHTTLPAFYEDFHIKNDSLRRLYARCAAQMLAVSRELFSGMFDEFPNLKFIHSMLGGGYFAYANMLVPQKSAVKEEMERFNPAFSQKVLSYLQRNMFFDITHAPIWGKIQLEAAIKTMGADHVLFGSSFPLRNEWLFKGVDFVKNLDISEEDKALVLGKNAQKLFNIQ